jgi:hypothetical protein
MENKRKDEIWEMFKDLPTLRETYRSAMEFYASEKLKAEWTLTPELPKDNSLVVVITNKNKYPTIARYHHKSEEWIYEDDSYDKSVVLKWCYMSDASDPKNHKMHQLEVNKEIEKL